MKSIQTKIILFVLCCTIFTTSLVLGVGYFATQRTLDRDSEQIMHLLCTETADQINETLRNVEQSVNTIYFFAEGQMGDTEDFFLREESLDIYIQKVKEVAVNSAENTEGAVAVYFRLSPELASPKAGILLSMNADGEFIDCPPTDLSQYLETDIEHVGWYYIPLKQGKPVWLDPYENKNLDFKMISYVIPVYYEGKTIGVIGMDIAIDLLRDMLCSTVVYDSGYVFLFDASGNIVYHPNYPDGLKKEDFSEEMDTFQEAMYKAQLEDGTMTYEWNGTKKQMALTTLANGMSLATTVPISEISAPKWRMLKTLLILVAIVLMFSIIIIHRWVKSIIRPLKQLTEVARKIASGDLDVTIECHTKDEVGVLAQSFSQTAASLREYIADINLLAYTDVLTRTRNKAFYEKTVLLLETDMKEEETNFAVVLMDINNLKATNDTYGHDKGDLLIMDAANIMKKVFGKEAVYRVGGDEFVAILRDVQLLRRRELLVSFDREVDMHNRNIGEKYASKFSIARGLAVYDSEQDMVFADVFKRADDLMYENKRQQKSVE